jgi:hypothetical protein
MLRWIAIVAYVTAGAVLGGASSSTAATLRSMVGHWVLLSVYEEDSSGHDLDRWGTAPEGRFIASPDGSFSFLLVGRNITRIAGSGVERMCVTLKACRNAIEQKVVGYAGKLSEALDGTVFFNVTGELERGWKDTAVVTSVKFDGDRMHFTSALHPSPTGAFYVHLIWSKKE